jgi:hypothetical protein
MSNLEKFLTAYRTELHSNVVANPTDYAWTPDKFDDVYARMEAAIKRGSFNKDSQTFKAVCKHLGIKHTYKAIGEYIGGYGGTGN